LIYDSLVQLNKEKSYQKIISKIRAIKSLTIALVSILGGLAYLINPRLPFFLTALFFGLSAIISLFLTEPIIDTKKINVIRAVKQTARGFKHLICSKFISRTILLFLIGAVVVTSFELIDDVVVVEAGFKSSQLGIIYALFGIIAAASSYLVPFVVKKISKAYTLFFAALFMSLAFIFTPFVSAITIVIFVLVRIVSSVFIENITSVLINRDTPSEDRATTLSTFNMMIQLPYALLAALLGSLIIKYSVFNVAAMIGIFLLAVSVLFIFILKINKYKDGIKVGG